MHPLVQIGEFQLPALVPNRGVSLDQFSDSRAVYVLNFAQVQHDRFLAFVRQISNNFAENDISFADRNSSADVNHGDSARLPDGGLHLDGAPSFHADSPPVQDGARRTRKCLRVGPNHNQRTSFFENFPEECDVLRRLISRCRLRRVRVVYCRRADGGTRARARNPEQSGGAEPQRKYRPNARKKQRGSHNSGGHPGGSSSKAPHIGAELFCEVLGVALGASRKNDGILRYTGLPQLPDRFLRVITRSEYSDCSFHMSSLFPSQRLPLFPAPFLSMF